jgi:uncharacterized protein (DUF1697 family)
MSLIKYIAFLRAVNVGGRVVKMETLVKIFESMQFKNVRTIIQSGNVIFESSQTQPKILIDKIEQRLKNQLEYEVKVMLRTKKQLEQIVGENPYNKITLNENQRVYIAFLKHELNKSAASILESLNTKNEKYFLGKSEVYCLITKQKKSSGFFEILQLEKKLNIPLTTRNQTTVSKIKEIMELNN